MSHQNTQEPSAATSYRLTLWLVLALATAMDTVLAVAVAHTHGILFGWWLFEKARADPLIGFVVADMVLLRLGLLMLALRMIEVPALRRLALWLIFIPLIGAPVLMAGLIANED